MAAETVTGAYLAVGLMTLIGIAVPLGAFVTSWAVRPRTDPARKHVTRSWLLEGFETDHSLYTRRLSTYECGSEPVGMAMIQFHFQYYWYAIIFLVFDASNSMAVPGAGLAAGIRMRWATTSHPRSSGPSGKWVPVIIEQWLASRSNRNHLARAGQ